tara:strand:- start:32297 stop:41485 length:9189 start_codon:yes stop_codon:yes gene_type:complete
MVCIKKRCTINLFRNILIFTSILVLILLLSQITLAVEPSQWNKKEDVYQVHFKINEFPERPFGALAYKISKTKPTAPNQIPDPEWVTINKDDIDSNPTIQYEVDGEGIYTLTVNDPFNGIPDVITPNAHSSAFFLLAAYDEDGLKGQDIIDFEFRFDDIAPEINIIYPSVDTVYEIDPNFNIEVIDRGAGISPEDVNLEIVGSGIGIGTPTTNCDDGVNIDTNLDPSGNPFCQQGDYSAQPDSNLDPERNTISLGYLLQITARDKIITDPSNSQNTNQLALTFRVCVDCQRPEKVFLFEDTTQLANIVTDPDPFEIHTINTNTPIIKITYDLDINNDVGFEIINSQGASVTDLFESNNPSGATIRQIEFSLIEGDITLIGLEDNDYTIRITTSVGAEGDIKTATEAYTFRIDTTEPTFDITTDPTPISSHDSYQNSITEIGTSDFLPDSSFNNNLRYFITPLDASDNPVTDQKQNGIILDNTNEIIYDGSELDDTTTTTNFLFEISDGANVVSEIREITIDKIPPTFSIVTAETLQENPNSVKVTFLLEDEPININECESSLLPPVPGVTAKDISSYCHELNTIATEGVLQPGTYSYQIPTSIFAEIPVLDLIYHDNEGNIIGYEGDPWELNLKLSDELGNTQEVIEHIEIDTKKPRIIEDSFTIESNGAPNSKIFVSVRDKNLDETLDRSIILYVNNVEVTIDPLTPESDGEGDYNVISYTIPDTGIPNGNYPVRLEVKDTYGNIYTNSEGNNYFEWDLTVDGGFTFQDPIITVGNTINRFQGKYFTNIENPDIKIDFTSIADDVTTPTGVVGTENLLCSETREKFFTCPTSGLAVNQEHNFEVSWSKIIGVGQTGRQQSLSHKIFIDTIVPEFSSPISLKKDGSIISADKIKFVDLNVVISYTEENIQSITINDGTTSQSFRTDVLQPGSQTIEPSFTLSNSGLNTITVTIVDQASNTISDSTTITVDMSPPTINDASITVTADQISYESVREAWIGRSSTNIFTITGTYNKDPGDLIQMTLDGNQPTDITNNDNPSATTGTFTFETSIPPAATNEPQVLNLEISDVDIPDLNDNLEIKILHDGTGPSISPDNMFIGSIPFDFIINTDEPATCSLEYYIRTGPDEEPSLVPTLTQNADLTEHRHDRITLETRGIPLDFTVNCEDLLGNPSPEKTIPVTWDIEPPRIDEFELVQFDQDVSDASDPFTKSYIISSRHNARIKVVTSEDSKCRFSDTETSYERMSEDNELKYDSSYDLDEDYKSEHYSARIALTEETTTSYNIACIDRAGLETEDTHEITIQTLALTLIKEVRPTGFIRETQPTLRVETNFEAECKVDDEFSELIVDDTIWERAYQWIVDFLSPAKQMHPEVSTNFEFPAPPTADNTWIKAWDKNFERGQEYNFEVSCQRMINGQGQGWQTAPLTFTIRDVTQIPTGPIFIHNPKFSVSPVPTFDLIVGTEEDLRCRWQYIHGDDEGFPYVSMLLFDDVSMPDDDLNFYRHTISDFNTESGGSYPITPDEEILQTNLNVQCALPDNLGNVLPPLDLIITIDTTAPVIESISNQPETVSNIDLETVLQIQTDDESRCKYGMNANLGDSIENQFTDLEYVFTDYDLEVFNNNPETIVELPVPEGQRDQSHEFTYTVICQNRAFSLSQPETITISYDLNVDLSIVDIQYNKFNSPDFDYVFETNEDASCRILQIIKIIEEGDNELIECAPGENTCFMQHRNSPGETGEITNELFHTISLENFDHGLYNFETECRDTHGLGDILLSDQEVIVDLTRPVMKQVNVSGNMLYYDDGLSELIGVSCNPGGFDLHYLAEEDLTDIWKYEYKLDDLTNPDDNEGIFDWNEGAVLGEDEWIFIGGLSSVLTEDSHYVFITKPYNTIRIIDVIGDQMASNRIKFNSTYCDLVSCGDGNLDPGEQCDLNNLDDQDCSDFGKLGGNTLFCNLPGTPNQCQLNPGQCGIDVCPEGDCEFENNEYCDNSGEYQTYVDLSDYCDSSTCDGKDVDCGVPCTPNSCDTFAKKWCREDEDDLTTEWTEENYCSNCVGFDSSCVGCGDGIQNTGEQCEFNDQGNTLLYGADCISATGDDTATGTLDCYAVDAVADGGSVVECLFNRDDCTTTAEHTCEDGTVDWDIDGDNINDEECELLVNGTKTCGDFEGFTGDVDVTCTGGTGCFWDTSNCDLETPQTCTEDCDSSHHEWCDSGTWRKAGYCSNCIDEEYCQGTTECGICGNDDGGNLIFPLDDTTDEPLDCTYSTLYTGGTLKCDVENCAFDTSECDRAPDCGNGIINPGEDCDINRDGNTIFGYINNCGIFEEFIDDTPTNKLKCSNTCSLDTSDCTKKPECGNGIINPGEECDGSNFGSFDGTCSGYSTYFNTEGTLGCTNQCLIDTTQCNGDDSDVTCGNNFIELGETCDTNSEGRGDTLPKFGAITDCSQYDEFDSGGPVTCTPECHIDTSNCIPAPTCGNGHMDIGETCDWKMFEEGSPNQYPTLDCDPYTIYFNGGALSCSETCELDTTSCTPAPTCKNNRLDGNDQCEFIGGSIVYHNNYDGTCSDYNDEYKRGSLGCKDNCEISTSNCREDDKCDNGQLDDNEQCDGNLFRITNTLCTTYSSNYESGTVSCDDDCFIEASNCVAKQPDPCQVQGSCDNDDECTKNSHCDSEYCNTQNVCDIPTCDDNVRNNDESDDDCGGSCDPCDNDERCSDDNDCESSNCDHGYCLEPNSCFNEVKDGLETDTDCGGVCEQCMEDAECIGDSDCANPLECSNGKCRRTTSSQTTEGKRDSDNDGIPDDWEINNGMNPNDPSDASKDFDSDGLTNKQEYDLHTKFGKSTNPNLGDTDKDGVSDKDELDENTDPTDPESFPKSNLGLIIFLVATILILLGGAGYIGYLMYTKKQYKPTFGAPKTQTPTQAPPTASLPRRPPITPRRPLTTKKPVGITKMFDSFKTPEEIAKEKTEAKKHPKTPPKTSTQPKKETKITALPPHPGKPVIKPKEDIFAKLKSITKEVKGEPTQPKVKPKPLPKPAPKKEDPLKKLEDIVKKAPPKKKAVKKSVKKKPAKKSKKK